ncbi:MAG TPA: hypothetical protein VMS56_06990 [Thermoanaerobaculia bacterium]|nr:hypothetical protein [Thermoanaerobaculia bacterium]
MTEIESGTDLKLLREVVSSLLRALTAGEGDKDKRRQVEDWLRMLSEKYPEFGVEAGLRDYYLAEAERLRREFDSVTDLTEKLNVGRAVESYLEKATDFARRAEENGQVG